MVEVNKAKRDKFELRRSQARELNLKSVRDREAKGVKDYKLYLKAVEERVEDHKQKDRKHSEAEFDSYKKQ